MAIDVRLKHSSVDSKVPLPGDLVDGELALNINANSPAAYLKDSAGNVVKLAGEGNIGSPDASETVKGLVEIATQAEVDAGTDDTRTITPLKAATTFVNVAGDTMTGALTLPQAVVPGVPVGWAQFGATGITAVELAAETPAYNIIDRVETGSVGTFRIFLKTGEEMPWNDFFVVVNVQTTSEGQTNASVHRDTANWPDNTLPCNSILVKTVRIVPTFPITADHVGCSVLIYMRG